ncbi:MAG: hypothetical protein CL814_14955 [Confluentimicrobium sp.]|jgi:hypothetical protein|nr:hypothetical protein [Actibacterium sp.]|tara:strand:- start:4138 stop:4821 length:684 start_codon:yes stop_codon:yes gene_type:complete
MAEADEMTGALHILRGVARAQWRRLMLWGFAFMVLSQVAMLAALILRFQALPNYQTFYNWPGNVARIIRSTPALSDMPGIIAEEWLVEIGRMNYDYGTGISEWSLNVIPSRLVVMFVLGILVGLCAALMRADRCSLPVRGSARAVTGLGAVLIAMTNATMSWVVCCATPSWVVGLAMMGLGVSSSLALETLGPWLNLGGFGLLLALALCLAWRRSRRATILAEPAHA